MPFDLEEMLARIRALLRRNQEQRSPLLTWGDLCLNPQTCEVTYQNQPVQLASKEYSLLELFLRNPDQVFNQARLRDRLWQTDECPTEGAVRSQMKGLRHKLKKAGVDDIFETIYKLGYRLKPSKTPEPDEEEEILIEAASKTNNKSKKNKDNRDKSAGEIPAGCLWQATAIIPSDLIPSNLSSDLQQVWQECRQSYRDRLTIIQQAITALHAGTLTPEQQHQAEREAHTQKPQKLAPGITTWQQTSFTAAIAAKACLGSPAIANM